MIYPYLGNEIVRHKFTFYSTSSLPLFKEYMETRRSEWEEGKDFKSDNLRAMYLNNYNNILTSERWSANYPKDS